MVKHIIICSNLIEKDKKFLFVKQTKEIAKNFYDFPSGTLEDNETLIECAIREAKEETGLNVKPLKIVSILQLPKATSGNNLVIIVFKSEIISGELTASKEHPEVKFISVEEIKKLDKSKLLRYGKLMLTAINNYLENKSVDLNFLKIF